MKKILNKSIFGFDNALMTLSSIFLFIAAIVSVINALMRATGLGGLIWSDEVSVLLMVFMVFFTQPLLEFSGSQLSIGFLDKFQKSKRVELVLETVRGVIIIIVIGYLAYYCWDTIERSMRFHMLTPVLRIPRYVLYGLMLVSFLLVIINWIIKIIGKFCRDTTPPGADDNASGDKKSGEKAESGETNGKGDL